MVHSSVKEYSAQPHSFSIKTLAIRLAAAVFPAPLQTKPDECEVITSHWHARGGILAHDDEELPEIATDELEDLSNDSEEDDSGGGDMEGGVMKGSLPVIHVTRT
eukprot:2561623-Rhodomonas_salina.1